MSRRGSWIAIVVALVAAAFAPGAQAAETQSVDCVTRTVPVTVALAPLTISGTHCQPSGTSPDAVTVLVPGATYDREYWDFGYQPETYSFARALARRGYATYAIDRLGSGQSSKPLSATITATAQANALHQLIGQLRADGFDGDGYGRVLVAGHSLGTGVAILEAATYDDTDGVVLTGLGHRLNAVGFSRLFFTQLHPALLDPAFAGTTLDPGYVTTKPGVRGEAFHAPAAVDPGVIAHDEATKDLFSLTEAPDLVALGVLLGYSNRITAPVLLLMGGQDSLNCATGASDCSSSAALHAQEQPYYVNARCFDARVLPGIGHALNLHPAAPGIQTTVADWADATAGSACP